MITLVGSRHQNVEDQVARIAAWASVSKKRLQFIARLILVCKNADLYKNTLDSLVDAFDMTEKVDDVRHDLDFVFNTWRTSLDQRRGDLLESIVAQLGPRDKRSGQVIR